VPTRYLDFVQTKLDPGTNPLFFVGTSFGRIATTSPASELRANLSTFESIGLRYVVAGAHQGIGKLLSGSTTVFDDGFVAIYELPDTAPYFSVEGGPCRLQIRSGTDVTADCAAPATLVRRELDYPGWSATVEGAGARVEPEAPIFMGVALPAGRSTVRFSYLPSFEHVAIPVAGAAMLGLVGIGLAPVVRRRRRLARKPPAAPAHRLQKRPQLG
jgi:hypothetical protein